MLFLNVQTYIPDRTMSQTRGLQYETSPPWKHQTLHKNDDDADNDDDANADGDDDDDCSNCFEGHGGGMNVILILREWIQNFSKSNSKNN